MDRVTTGLFYDVIDGGGPVRDEIGHRFEAYAIDLLRAMLATTTFRSENVYRTRLGSVDTPDIVMIADDGAVGLAIECKAVRMTIAARFGTRPGEARGYDEIAKGVMQLWRFFAHCRQGRTGCTVRDDALGLVLTLDEWFAGRSSVIAAVLARAHDLADANAHDIPVEDRRAVAFCTISELETALVTATPASLLDTVRIAAKDRQGWIFSSLHADCAAPKAPPRSWPFDDALQRLLPWYDRLATIAEGAD